MQAGFERQILLGPAFLGPEPLEVNPHLLTDVHRPKQAGLQIFSLQTISLISLDFRLEASVAGGMITSLNPTPTMRALTSSQISKIGEALAASQLMLASGGRLSPFLPGQAGPDSTQREFRNDSQLKKAAIRDLRQRGVRHAWTHPGKVEAPYTVCIASASNLTGLVKSSVECRRTGL